METAPWRRFRKWKGGNEGRGIGGEEKRREGDRRGGGEKGRDRKIDGMCACMWVCIHLTSRA